MSYAFAYVGSPMSGRQTTNFFLQRKVITYVCRLIRLIRKKQHTTTMTMRMKI